MNTSSVSSQLEQLGNFIGLLVVIGILTLAFLIQLDMGELPCPLCLLQRVGFIGIGIGFLMNLYFGNLTQHYAIAILSALFTGSVGLRQVALHILPDTGSYGTPIFGIHLYTWSAISAFCFVVGIAVLLLLHSNKASHVMARHRTTKIFAFLFALIVLANVVSVFLECGLSVCPDNPSTYEIIDRLTN